MNIILKENEYAERLIAARDIGNKRYEDLRMVARYYLDIGYSKREARGLLERFILQCDPDYNLVKWSDYLDNVMSGALKREAVDIESIGITYTEMDTIDRLLGTQTRRLAFTLLCLAKYHIKVNPECDYWVGDEAKDVMAMANISVSARRRGALYRALRDAGLIRFSKKVDNTSVRVCFVDNDIAATLPDIAMNITDFRNVGYQYMMYHGGSYFECENCGITTKIKNPKNGRPPKYCKECASKIYIQQSVNSVMRQRKLA